MKQNLLHQTTTQEILDAFYCVYNVLGYGFLEKVYENALGIALRDRGYRVLQQSPIRVYFGKQVVGEYYADLLVDDCVIVELKAADTIGADHLAQLLNYLKATEIEVGLLLNFGPEPKFARKVFSNTRKQGGSICREVAAVPKEMIRDHRLEPRASASTPLQRKGVTG